MNKTERDELRRLIRARFKVLRSDVDQRKAELLAELEQEITAKFADEDRRWNDAMYVIEQARLEANRKINDVYRGLIPDLWGGHDRDVVTVRHAGRPNHQRGVLRIQGEKQVDARCRAALLELERREVDLLTELATSALESAEAVAFMGRIPTVSELVPASRLREIEAQL